jgi:hypothetical protein
VPAVSGANLRHGAGALCGRFRLARVSAPTLELPVGARFASWFGAYADGRTSLDDALDAITGADAAHHVLGLDGDVTPLALALGRLRSGATSNGLAHVALVLPASGDPVGLAGPPGFNAEAVDAGQAVLLGGAGLGLVPRRTGAGVTWQVSSAHVPAPPDVREADRELRTALRDAADALATLDVARWQPDVADALMDLRRPTRLALPPGTDAGAVALAGSAVRALAIVALADDVEGGAVTAQESESRSAALRPLDRAGRRALAAACSGPVAG